MFHVCEMQKKSRELKVMWAAQSYITNVQKHRISRQHVRNNLIALSLTYINTWTSSWVGESSNVMSSGCSLDWVDDNIPRSMQKTSDVVVEHSPEAKFLKWFCCLTDRLSTMLCSCHQLTILSDRPHYSVCLSIIFHSQGKQTSKRTCLEVSNNK